MSRVERKTVLVEVQFCPQFYVSTGVPGTMDKGGTTVTCMESLGNEYCLK
jgi:hypothetical protein